MPGVLWACSVLSGAAALALGTACAHRPVTPPPPRGVETVAVLRPNNRTGDALLVAGTSLLERYAFESPRITVPDVLAAEARALLARRGFTVAAPGALDAATGGRAPTSVASAATLASDARLGGFALYLEIRRWEADVAGSMHPAFVIVGLDATLVDGATGRVAWAAHRPVHPVPTRGAVTLAAAYEIAAEAEIEDLLGTWQPAPPSGEAR